MESKATSQPNIRWGPTRAEPSTIAVQAGTASGRRYPPWGPQRSPIVLQARSSNQMGLSLVRGIPPVPSTRATSSALTHGPPEIFNEGFIEGGGVQKQQEKGSGYG
ncbi:hypothetical protein H0H92_002980 [Tricholoma furcatifolium]|nr:hypothetical protein H0H92_002980 [Tricholoma furcatifolium]